MIVLVIGRSARAPPQRRSPGDRVSDRVSDRVAISCTEVASTERYRMAVPNSSCNVWSSVSIEDWRSMSKPQRASSHMSSRGLVRGRVRANPNPNQQA